MALFDRQDEAHRPCSSPLGNISVNAVDALLSKSLRLTQRRGRHSSSRSETVIVLIHSKKHATRCANDSSLVVMLKH